MKTTRIIIGCIFAAIAIAIIALVLIQWHAQGCSVWSLIGGIAFYLSAIAGIWATIDSKFTH